MKFKRTLLALCMSAVMVGSLGLTVSANSGIDLNAIGGDTSQSATVGDATSNGAANNAYSETNEAVISNIDENANITEDDMERATKIVAPIVNTVRWVIAVLLVLFPVLLILNTMIDFLCITLSPFRRAVTAVNGGGAGGGGMPGMGGMGGMGMPGQAAGGDDGSIFTTVAKWASDEAVAAIQDSQGGGGMGMSPYGGAPQQGGGKKKSVLLTYFKKRVTSLVIAGVCIVCFACTAFTDLGLKLGAFIVEKLGLISI